MHEQLWPRNIEQFYNFKQAIKKDQKLTACEFVGLYFLHSYRLNSFVRQIVLIPEFTCILTLDSAFELANRFYEKSNKQDLDPVVTYDATFNLCEFYVCTLVMKIRNC